MEQTPDKNASIETAQQKQTGKALLGEFFRYVLVGGLAFLADWGSLVLLKEYVLPAAWGDAAVYAATAAAFVIGLTVNFILSNLFVFTAAYQKKKGKSFGAFLVFAVIGLIGLLLTELGMWLCVSVLPYERILTGWGLAGFVPYFYMFAKVVVAAAVLVWNYIGRKLIIYK